MRSLLALVFAVLVSTFIAVGQSSPAPASIHPAKFDAEITLAKLALEAHGGEKLRAMKSLVVRGGCDITTSAVNQAIPAAFILVIAKQKYRIELINQFQTFKQAFDGENTTTNIQGGMSMPPINRIGFPILQMVGEPGFVITPLPEDKKQKRGFRMTSPEGSHTDFYLDAKTNQIKGYDATFEVNGRTATSSVEVDKLRVVDGVSVPERYAQRFDLGQLTVYADFKVKEILVNSQLDPDVFAIGK
jgi:hypothetical protein